MYIKQTETESNSLKSYANMLRQDIAPLNLTGATILIVDDAPDVLHLCSKLFETAHSYILTARNGLEAIEVLERESPTVVVMDLQMPVVSGFEAVKRMRECGHMLPVLGMTAHALDYSVERLNCMKLGFSDLISKPFGRQKLLEMTCAAIQNSKHYEFERKNKM